MAKGGHIVTHSEEWWAKAPLHVLRCNGHYKTTGLPCRREGLPGTSVCREHGGLSPATRAAAATRIQMTSDEAARHLVEWMNDAKVDMRERVKIAQDLLDRGGLSGAQTIKLMPITEDPIEALFRSIFTDPDALLEAEQPALPAAAPTRTSSPSVVGSSGPQSAEVVLLRRPQASEAPPRRNPTIPPKHIREALRDLL